MDGAGVAVGADVVLARLRVRRDGAGALEAVVAAVGGRDGVSADLAGGGEGERLEAPEADGVGACGERRAAGAGGDPGAAAAAGWCAGARRGRHVGERQQGVRAALALVHAAVAEAPVALVARLAAPVALVRPRRAPHAEHAALEAARRVVRRERPAPLRAARHGLGLPVPARGQHVRLLEALVAPRNPRSVPVLEGRVAEAEPVLASLPGAVAVRAEVPRTVGALGTVVVELVLDVRPPAS